MTNKTICSEFYYNLNQKNLFSKSNSPNGLAPAAQNSKTCYFLFELLSLQSGILLRFESCWEYKALSSSLKELLSRPFLLSLWIMYYGMLRDPINSSSEWYRNLGVLASTSISLLLSCLFCRLSSLCCWDVPWFFTRLGKTVFSFITE